VIGRTRRVMRLPQWMCPPTATIQPRPFSPSPPPSPRLRRTGLPSPPPRAGKHQGRGGCKTATNPYGADGRIADEYGVCQYILAPGGHGLHRRGAENAENDGNRGTGKRKCRMQSAKCRMGKATDSRRDPRHRRASLGCARDDNLTTHGETPRLAALPRGDSTRGMAFRLVRAGGR